MPSKQKKADKKKVSKSKSKSSLGQSSSRRSLGGDESSTDLRGSVDFEAGLMFERYDKEGRGSLSREQFKDMWREYSSKKQAATEAASKSLPIDAGRTFEAGQLFQRYDSSGNGAISKRDFERLMVDISKTADARQEGDPNATAYANAAPYAQTKATVPGRTRPVYDAAPPSVFPPNEGKTVLRSAENYTHFDETSGVPVPAERVGYHVATGHTVVPLMDAYTKRHSRLCALLSRRLMPRREQLMNVLRRIRSRVEDVRARRSAIERTTMQDVETIIERLRSAEALKLSTLGSQLSELQAEVEAIDRVTEQVEGARSSGGVGAGIVDLGGHEIGPLSSLDIIQMFPELCATIDRLSSRPVNSAVDVPVEDLPTETAERLEVLRRADKYEEALSLKDAMLWELLQEREALTEKKEKDFSTLKGFEDEMANWLMLSDRMAEEISSLRSQLREQEDIKSENQALRHEIAILRAKQSERDSKILNKGIAQKPHKTQSGYWIYPQSS